MRPARIDVHIKELVVHGFPPSQRYAIGEAVERALGQMLTLHPGPYPLQVHTNIEELNAGSFRVRVGARPETVGAGIALKIFQGLTSELGV